VQLTYHIILNRTISICSQRYLQDFSSCTFGWFHLRFCFLGHYVPQLSNVILEENKKASKENYINFKGILVCTTQCLRLLNHLEIPGFFLQKQNADR
jgi:hypothetical protein